MGIMLGMPAIGISKNVLCGRYDPPEKEGQAEPLIYEGDVVGYSLLSRKGCRPIIVAPGHMVFRGFGPGPASGLRGHKLPEPCRLAHEQARKIKMGLSPKPATSGMKMAPRSEPFSSSLVTLGHEGFLDLQDPGVSPQSPARA